MRYWWAKFTACLSYPGTLSIWVKHSARFNANGKGEILSRQIEDHLAPEAPSWHPIKMQVRMTPYTRVLLATLLQGVLQPCTITQYSVMPCAVCSVFHFFPDYYIEITAIYSCSFYFSLFFFSLCTNNTNNRSLRRKGDCHVTQKYPVYSPFIY